MLKEGLEFFQKYAIFLCILDCPGGANCSVSYMKLKVRPLAYTLAILYGVYLFLAAFLSYAGLVIPFLNSSVVQVMGDVFVGYTATPGGAVVGLIYGLAWGGLWGVGIGWLYNRLVI